jgi:DnaJ-class molecular chaperone
MEVTKWLKPSISVSQIGDSASVQAATRVNAEQSSKRTMRRSTRQPNGDDLHHQVPISETTATLGGEVEIQCIDGRRILLKIPKGTQAGKLFRLRREGMPKLRSKRVGDMYVEVVVETPTK